LDLTANQQLVFILTEMKYIKNGKENKEQYNLSLTICNSIYYLHYSFKERFFGDILLLVTKYIKNILILLRLSII
jgi:hypothetical protein